jgi:hypothetical protein
MRAREGLPPDAMILAPAFTAAPMLLPADVWAMLVVAADIVDDNRPRPRGRAGSFRRNLAAHPADLAEGDLVVRMVEVDDGTPPRPEEAISIDMLMANDGRWQRAGCWYKIDAGLVRPGDLLVWDRRHLGERHTAQVRDDGLHRPRRRQFLRQPIRGAHRPRRQTQQRMAVLEARLRRAHLGRLAGRAASATRAVKLRVPCPY